MWNKIFGIMLEDVYYRIWGLDTHNKAVVTLSTKSPVINVTSTTAAFNTRALKTTIGYVPRLMHRAVKSDEDASATSHLFREGEPVVSVSPRNLRLNARALRLGPVSMAKDRVGSA